MNDQEERLALVTGATGFTGGHLARTLLDRGWRVRVLARRPEAARGLADQGAEVVAGDITDPKAVAQATQGCTHVFHIAAYYRGSSLDAADYRAVNVDGTQYVLDAADKAGVTRVVHCSTAGVHGDVATIPAKEDAPFNPGDVYQETKLEGELLAAEAIKTGLPGAIFRPVGIYGPGDTRFLKLFRAIHRRRFIMFGKGEVLYHLTYISDLVDGIILLGTHENALGETFILAGERYYTLKDLVAMVGKAVGVAPRRGRIPISMLLVAAHMSEAIARPLRIDAPLQVRQCDFFTKDRAFDISKARELLGYNPTVELPDGLGRTAQWYQDEGMLG
ncbi:NAD-dependent epimerase/dehydratase family protein [Ruegeria hyattellae]|uniref:NAD-dependent epimerase/dehydratase family protein n=1 Tax=Ruegeria hyattellae TaxID=3233337 RepID=UPI00355B20B7